MKAKCFIFFAIFFLFTAGHAHADDYHGIWYATSLTGGGAGALDAVASGVSISEKDSAFVVMDNRAYLYHVTLSGKAENSPKIIVPDDVGIGLTRFELSLELTGATVFIPIARPDLFASPDDQYIWVNDTGTTFFVTNAIFRSVTSGCTVDGIKYSASAVDFSYANGVSMFLTAFMDSAKTGFYEKSYTGVTPVPTGRAIVMNWGSVSSDFFSLTLGGYFSEEQ